jgi:archaetidylinositol phosphate synthase
MARVMVRPLLRTWVRPNHLTTMRLLSGLAACIAFSLGSRTATMWGGVLWLASAFLDRADGELARIGNLMSPGGHRYDYYADTIVNTLFFVSIGVGLRHSWLQAWAMPLGILSGTSMFLCNLFSEWIELRSPSGTKAYTGRWGFDPDDALYLLAPIAWLGWLAPILVAACVGTTLIMLITGWRLLGLRGAWTQAPLPKR